MPHTFEELAGREIDGLFRGSLFLTGGREAAAEELLLWTVRRAFHAFRRGENHEDFERWLDARLAQEFLEVVGRLGTEEEQLESALYRATADMPPRARVALWLVLLRRWRYEETSALLGSTAEDLKELLSHRQALSDAIARPDEGSANGTHGP
jgi:DNA-directed RNA polymerase specialized sigma24 family protein